LFDAMLGLAMDGGAEGGADGGAEGADTAVRVLMNETLPAPAAAMLDAVVSSCADGLNHQAAAAASALFEFMSRRLGEIAARDEVVPVEVIAPVHVHRAEKRMKNRSGVVPARAAARLRRRRDTSRSRARRARLIPTFLSQGRRRSIRTRRSIRRRRRTMRRRTTTTKRPPPRR
jgi:hypothetical protein